MNQSNLGPVIKVREPEKCEIINCPQNNYSNTCAASISDHPDSIRPSRCYHRKFILKK